MNAAFRIRGCNQRHPQVRPNDAVKRNQEERNMPRIMHRVYGPALPAAILLIGIGAMGMGGAAAQGSPENALLPF